MSWRRINREIIDWRQSLVNRALPPPFIWDDDAEEEDGMVKTCVKQNEEVRFNPYGSRRIFCVQRTDGRGRALCLRACAAALKSHTPALERKKFATDHRPS